MFPVRLREVSDPMTGFFLIDRRSVVQALLRPRGFKILLEILARRPMRIAEVPFDFADRHAGESKASLRQGVHFLTQLTALRFGKMSLFAVIGGLGAVANVAIVSPLLVSVRSAVEDPMLTVTSSVLSEVASMMVIAGVLLVCVILWLN